MCKEVYQINELIESHMHLVSFTIAKYFYAKDRHTRDEMTSVGYEALVRAARKFDPEVAKFTTFAVLKIRFALIDYFRKEYKHEVACSLDLKLDGGSALHDLIEDVAARYEEDIDLSATIDQWLACLNEEEREIVSLFVGLGEKGERCSLEAIGKTHGMSTYAIWTRKQSAIAKLRSEVLAG